MKKPRAPTEVLSIVSIKDFVSDVTGLRRRVRAWSTDWRRLADFRASTVGKGSAGVAIALMRDLWKGRMDEGGRRVLLQRLEEGRNEREPCNENAQGQRNVTIVRQLLIYALIGSCRL